MIFALFTEFWMHCIWKAMRYVLYGLILYLLHVLLCKWPGYAASDSVL